MNEICDMLLYWTLKQYDPASAAIGSEHFRELSPEVYDRAVSIIGICVPLGIYFLVISSIFMLMFSFMRIFGGGKGGK